MTFREALTAKHITPAELARRIDKSERMVHYYLSGRWPIRKATARVIAFSTGIPLSIILSDGKGE